jgi:hypothetical protein
MVQKLDLAGLAERRLTLDGNGVNTGTKALTVSRPGPWADAGPRPWSPYAGASQSLRVSGASGWFVAR